MFQTSFQGGQFIEIYDPKDDKNKANKEKEKFYSNLYKITSPNQVIKNYDKSMKSYILEINGHSTKMIFPKDEKMDLCLVQQYLLLQIFIPHGVHWSMELGLTDTQKTKRRIMITSSVKALEKKYFHLKIPIDVIRRNVWLNLCVDVFSFMEGFKGQTFRSLDQIIISSTCKIRKLFTIKNQVQEDEAQSTDFPKSLNYPSGFQYENQSINYQILSGLNFLPEYIESSQGYDDTSQNQSKKQTFIQFNNREKSPKSTTKSKTLKQEEKERDKSPFQTSNKQIQKQAVTPQKNLEIENIEENIEAEDVIDYDNHQESLVSQQFQSQDENKMPRQNNQKQTQQTQSRKNLRSHDPKPKFNFYEPLSGKQMKITSHEKDENATTSKKEFKPNPSKLDTKKITPTQRNNKNIEHNEQKEEKQFKQPSKSNPWRSKKEINNEFLESQDKPQKVLASNHMLKQQKEKIPKAEKEKKVNKEKLQTNKNKEKNPGYDTSESDFYQMSQKFNTVTDPKKFQELGLLVAEQNHNQEEIEENIELEPSLQHSGCKDIKILLDLKNTQQKLLQNSPKMLQEQESKQNENTFAEGFYMNKLKNLVNERPTSSFSMQHSNLQTQQQDGQMVEMIYDPLLNCYYQPSTNQYFQLN